MTNDALVSRIRSFLGLRQCTAMQKVNGGKGFICCVRRQWHIGPHKTYTGKIMRGDIIREPIGD